MDIQQIFLETEKLRTTGKDEVSKKFKDVQNIIQNNKVAQFQHNVS